MHPGLMFVLLVVIIITTPFVVVMLRAVADPMSPPVDEHVAAGLLFSIVLCVSAWVALAVYGFGHLWLPQQPPAPAATCECAPVTGSP